MPTHYKKYLLFSFFFFTFFIVKAQTTNSLYTKAYVKKNSVLLRWVPADKKVFDIGVTNGYKITRYIKENNQLINPIIIATSVKPYSETDSIAWGTLLQMNPNATIVPMALYQKNIPSELPATEKATQEQILYNLLLLSCDFNADVAKSCGLFFKDSTIDNSKTYSYKIEINNVPTSSKISAYNLEVNTTQLSTNPPINNLTATFKNKLVKLKWTVTSTYKSNFGGYNLERSTDSINYTKINESPFILLKSQDEKNKDYIIHNDTFPTTKVKYYYRIKGINFFGEESQPSNVVTGIGYDELKSFPIIDSIKTIENRKVYIHWQMKDPLENNSPKEYLLMRSKTDDGKYDVLYKSSKEFSFLDEKPQQANYYKIVAISLGNDTLKSYSSLALIADTIPPAIPTGLKATVDAKGNVEITWDKNSETDLQGYKLYKANSLKEEFVQVNDKFATTTSYKTKLNLKTLTKKIYYTISATDNNYNSSEMSTPIEVSRPDTIPPVRPIIKNAIAYQEGIKISWIPSSSDDIKQYVLYHQAINDPKESQIKIWANSDTATSFIDTTVVFGTTYKYKIMVMDEDDNISFSNTTSALYETGYRKKITEITHEVDRTKKTITLKWNYSEKEIERFVIYRAKKNESLTIIKTIAFPEMSFIDKALNIGNIYEYRIKAVFKNGAESIISDKIEVTY